MCPKGHGPLRRDDREGIAICITCGYEEPLEKLPNEGDFVGDKEQVTHYVPTLGEGKYADKPIKIEGHGRGYRYPEDIKVHAVREVEGGADKEEVCERVGCHLITLDKWIIKYGGKEMINRGDKEIPKQYICPICNKPFSSQQAAAGHMTAHRNILNDPLYILDRAEKQFRKIIVEADDSDKYKYKECRQFILKAIDVLIGG